MIRNRRGRALVLSDEREKSTRRIFIPDGYEAGGWWRFMKAISELSEIPLVNPFKLQKKVASPTPMVNNAMFLSPVCFAGEENLRSRTSVQRPARTRTQEKPLNPKRQPKRLEIQIASNKRTNSATTKSFSCAEHQYKFQDSDPSTQCFSCSKWRNFHRQRRNFSFLKPTKCTTVALGHGCQRLQL